MLQEVLRYFFTSLPTPPSLALWRQLSDCRQLVLDRDGANAARPTLVLDVSVQCCVQPREIIKMLLWKVN